ncbi:MAG: C25 family cysteine peptidase, partial [Candidatus Ranarchaeia archaeon]
MHREKASRYRTAVFAVMILGLIIAPLGVQLLFFQANPFLSSEKTPVVSPSLAQLPTGVNFTYVVITPAASEPLLGGLVNWKRLKGVPATLVTVEFINVSYGGIDLQEKIRAFIIAARDTWGVEYVLLAGDMEAIPARYIAAAVDGHPDDAAAGFTAEYNNSLPSDMYYAGLDSTWDSISTPNLIYGERSSEADWYADVIVGRLPGSGDELVDMVDKIIEYEKYPFDQAMNNTLLIASDLYNSGVFSGVNYSEDIVLAALDDVFWDFTRLYNQTTPAIANLTKDGVFSNMTQGNYTLINLVTMMLPYMSYYNTSDGAIIELLNSTIATNLPTPGNPFMYLSYGPNSPIDYVTSSNYSVNNGDTLGETLIRSLNGPIGIVGNTRSVWTTQGDYTQMGFYFWNNLTAQTDWRPAVALYGAKAEYARTVGGPFVFFETEEWKMLGTQIYLGDPETPLWIGNLNQLEVQVQNQVYIDQFLTVRVTADGGTPVNNSLVSMMSNQSRSITRAYTNASGYAEIRAPSTNGTYILLAQKDGYDHKVVEGDILDNSDPVVVDYVISPNPVLRLNQSLMVTANITDVENGTVGWATATIGTFSFTLAYQSGITWSGSAPIPKGGPVGNQSIIIRGIDVVNNHTGEASDFVYIQSTAPRVVSTSANASSVFKNQTLMLSTNVTDYDNYVENLSVEFIFTSAIQTFTFEANLSQALYSIVVSFNTTWLAGVYQIVVVVYDDLPLNASAVVLESFALTGSDPKILNVVGSTTHV